MKIIERTWPWILISISFLLGAVYAIHQTDPHHWGFIIGTVMDFASGKSLFNEVYIQYGVGQSLLFSFLGHILPVNYTTLGFYTSAVYATHLCLVFFGVKKLTSTRTAVVISVMTILFHSYAIYPWPDYYAGLFLVLGCSMMISDRGKMEAGSRDYLPGVFFFLAFLFRNTYFLLFLATTLAYGVLALMRPQYQKRKILFPLGSFFALLLAYFLMLQLQGKWTLWFTQTISEAGASYQIGFKSLWTLVQRAFFPHKFWLPNNLVYTSYSVLYYMALIIFLRALFNRGKESPLIVFFSLLGIAGLSQAALGYEIFRLQNASVSLFFVLALVSQRLPNWKTQKAKIAFSIYLILLVTRFPHASSLWPVFEAGEYSFSRVSFFKYHRFGVAEESYYQGLSSALCDGKSKIMNLTMDSTISYLCPGQSNAFGLPYYQEPFLVKINLELLVSQKQGFFAEDTLIVSNIPIRKNPLIQLIEKTKVTMPASTRYLGESLVTVYQVKHVKN